MNADGTQGQELGWMTGLLRKLPQPRPRGRGRGGGGRLIRANGLSAGRRSAVPLVSASAAVQV